MLFKTILWTTIISVGSLFLIFLVEDLYYQIVENKVGNNALFWAFSFSPFVLAVTLPLAIISYLLIAFFEWKDKDKEEDK